MSVVIPCYNYAAYVGQAIESVLRQTYPCEVVVVDDGSTDESPEVIGSFGSEIIALAQENSGLPATWNAGYSATSGDIVVFLDADDFLYEDALERIVERWSPEIASWMWWLDVVDADGRQTGNTVPKSTPDTDDLAELIRRRGPASRITPPSSGLAWSRAFLDEIMPLPVSVRLGADYYAIDSAPFHGPVVFVDAHLGAYRLHGASMTETGKPVTIETLEMNRSKYDVRGKRLSASGIGDPDDWLRRNWRQQTIRCLIAKHKGTDQPSIAAMAAAGWAADGSVVKRAGLAGLATLIRILPLQAGVALASRVIDFKWT